MSVITTAVSTYCDQNRKELLAKSVAGASTFSTPFVEVISGIKPGSNLQRKFFSTVPQYNWDAVCGEPSGTTTTFTEKLLTTNRVMAGDMWCADQLSDKLAQYLPAGTNSNEAFDIPTEVIDDLLAQVQKDNAIGFWQAGRASAPANNINTNMTGILKRLINTSLSGSTFKPVSTYTAITASNAIAAVDDWMTAVPAAIQGEQLEMRVPYDFFNSLKAAYRNTYGAGSLEVVPGAIDSFRLFGYDNVTVTKDNGLSGAKVAVMSIATAGNLCLTVDLAGDSAEVAVGYDFKSDKTIFRLKYAIGTQIKFEDEIGVLNYN